MTDNILVYIAVMALVTYLIRAVPIALVKGKIESAFIKSFIYYVPYAVLSAMTIPAIFHSTSNFLSASIGLAVSVTLSFLNRSLLTVALCACASVLICETIMTMGRAAF